MTIVEKIRTEQEIRREFLREQGRKYREGNRAKYNRYNREYYRKHRDKVSEKMYGPDERKCYWCGSDITHIKPRTTHFCNQTHRKHYNAKRKKEWLARKKLQAVVDMQQAKVSSGQ